MQVYLCIPLSFMPSSTLLIKDNKFPYLFRFMRAVAYRAFTRLVHGKLGRKRLPLPTCAYNAIRSRFNLLYERATGYAERDEDE